MRVSGETNEKFFLTSQARYCVLDWHRTNNDEDDMILQRIRLERENMFLNQKHQVLIYTSGLKKSY